MKDRGYITTAGKHHYLLLTEKRHITIYVIVALVRKIIETKGFPPEKAETIINDRTALAEVRKRIQPCTLEICADHIHIEVGKSERPSVILNYPKDDDTVIIFAEGKVSPIIQKTT